MLMEKGLERNNVMMIYGDSSAEGSSKVSMYHPSLLCFKKFYSSFLIFFCVLRETKNVRKETYSTKHVIGQKEVKKC